MVSWTDSAAKNLEKAAKHLKQDEPADAAESLNAALTELQANGWKWDNKTNNLVWGE